MTIEQKVRPYLEAILKAQDLAVAKREALLALKLVQKDGRDE